MGAASVLALALVVLALAVAGLLRRALTTDEDALLVERVDEVRSLIEAGSLTSVLDPLGPESPQVQVVDSSGAVVAAATVRAVGATTGQMRATTTAERGEHSFPAPLHGHHCFRDISMKPSRFGIRTCGNVCAFIT